MQALKNRICALEQSSRTDDMGPMYVHFVDLDTAQCEIQRITIGDQEWRRLANESEQELKDRAVREAPPPAPKCGTVFFCY